MARSKNTARPNTTTQKAATKSTNGAKVSKFKPASKTKQPANTKQSSKAQPLARAKKVATTERPAKIKQPRIRQPTQAAVKAALKIPESQKTWGKVRLGYDKRGTDLEDPIQLREMILAQACTSHPDPRVWLLTRSSWRYNSLEFADTSEDQDRPWSYYDSSKTTRGGWLIQRRKETMAQVVTAALEVIQGRDLGEPQPPALPVDLIEATTSYNSMIFMDTSRLRIEASRPIHVTAVFKDNFSWDGDSGKYKHGHTYARTVIPADSRYQDVLEMLKAENHAWHPIPPGEQGKFTSAAGPVLPMKNENGQDFAEAGWLNFIDTLENVDFELWVAPRLDGSNQIWNWSEDPSGRLNKWISNDHYEGDDEPCIYMEVRIVKKTEAVNDPVDENGELINQDEAGEPEDDGSEENLTEPDDNVIDDYEIQQPAGKQATPQQDDIVDSNPSSSDSDSIDEPPERPSKPAAKSYSSTSAKTASGVGGRGVARLVKQGVKTAKPSDQDSVAGPSSARASKRKSKYLEDSESDDSDSVDEVPARASNAFNSKQSHSTQAAKKHRAR